MRKVLPSPFYNLTSLLGALLALTILLVIIFLFVVESFARETHPYMGLVTFCVLPVFLILGLLLIALGAIRQYRRERAGVPEAQRLPVVDLNVSRYRNAVAFFSVGTFMFLLVSAFGSYQAYEYTDSVEFCGRVCHAVMKPEYTAYMASPHARVACVQCHIGAGATWFVRSKISGSYQVYAAAFHKYPKPIPTPVENLRPARETCEQCHWPRQFYAAKLQAHTYFLSDDKNTRSQVNLLVRIGGGDPRHGATEGIHYHMYLANQVSYVSTDKQNEVIPYVEAKQADGNLKVWKSTDAPITDAQIQNGKRHLVDCIECHNRPTHIFHHPAQSVNQAMQLGYIDPALPNIKKLAVDTLEKPYKTEDEAKAAIKSGMEEYYRSNSPQVLTAQRPQLDAAIGQVQKIYGLNYFPEMAVSWKAHPDHIGHLYSQGCFRCHDGKHVASDGSVLSRDCNSCHTILSQTNNQGVQRTSLTGLEFDHPGSVGDAWKTMNCTDCHAKTGE